MKWIWIKIVQLFGWKFHLPAKGERPELNRCIFAVAPHTSIYDFMVGAAYLWALDVNGKIFIKKEFFVWPLGPILRKLGAISVDRGNRHNGMVETAVKEFAKGGTFSIAITPEGTRKPVKRWKRGFYDISTKANVPIIPACINFKSKEIYLKEAFYPSGDFMADLPVIMKHFEDVEARHPEKYNKRMSNE